MAYQPFNVKSFLYVYIEYMILKKHFKTILCSFLHGYMFSLISIKYE